MHCILLSKYFTLGFVHASCTAFESSLYTLNCIIFTLDIDAIATLCYCIHVINVVIQSNNGVIIILFLYLGFGLRFPHVHYWYPPLARKHNNSLDMGNNNRYIFSMNTWLLHVMHLHANNMIICMHVFHLKLYHNSACLVAVTRIACMLVYKNNNISLSSKKDLLAVLSVGLCSRNLTNVCTTGLFTVDSK